MTLVEGKLQFWGLINSLYEYKDFWKYILNAVSGRYLLPGFKKLMYNSERGQEQTRSFLEGTVLVRRVKCLGRGHL